MFCSSRRSIKPALWLVFTLLLIMTMAIPAQAAVTGLSVEAENPTAYVKSDYTLKFSADSDITTGDTFTVKIFSNFDISETNPDNVKLTVNNTDYTENVSISSSDYNYNLLEVSVTSQVYANEEITLFIPDILNPIYEGDFDFGQVGLNNDFTNSNTRSLDIYNPELTITPDHDTLEVNLRDKITIALKDHNGNEFKAPVQVTGEIYGPGEFYAAPVDTPQLYQPVTFEIPQGSSSAEIYYRPTWVGDHNISVYTNHSPYLTAASTIKVIAAGGVNTSLSTEYNGQYPYYDLFFVAGQARKVYVAVTDQQNHFVVQPQPLKVELFTQTQSGKPSETGHFYAGIDENGKPVGDPIYDVTIPQDKITAEVYFYDTKATGEDYQLSLGTKINPNYFITFPANVAPANSNKLSLKLTGYDNYQENSSELGSRLFIANSDGLWRIQSQRDLQGKVPSGTIFPIEISIVDANGNPVKQASELTIKLTLEGNIIGTFYEYANFDNVEPITQVTIDSYESSKTIYFVANGSGEAVIKASGGLLEENLPITVQQADRLAIHFPLYWEYDETTNEDVEKERNIVGPEERLPFIVTLTDDQGHPVRTESDIIVNLAGASFFKDYDDRTAISNITIPAGYHGVQVYVEGPENEGTIKINAATTATGISGTGDKDVKVVLEGFFCTELRQGWNTLSTPVVLERKTLEQVIEKPDNIVLVYTYDAAQRTWLQIYKNNDDKWYNEDGSEFKLEPQMALFVKTKGETDAHFIASRTLNAPPTRSLAAGWNLISPAIESTRMKVNEVLSSIDGKYSQAVSPGIGWQVPWAYVPGSKNKPPMEAGRGYWVYMKEAGALAGFSSTPVKHYWYNAGGGGGGSQPQL